MLDKFVFVVVVGLCAKCVYSSCSEDGPCEICPLSEAESVHCIPTQRRQSYFCTTGGEEEEYFHSCVRTTEEEMIRVIVFELIVAIIGAASYWVVQDRKRKSMSLFESRKVKLSLRN